MKYLRALEAVKAIQQRSKACTLATDQILMSVSDVTYLLLIAYG